MARRDRESKKLLEALDLLERLIHATKTEYEMYFMGILKVPPEERKRDIKRHLRELTDLRLQNTAMKFKLRVLRGRFNTLNTYWIRTCKEIEEGRYRRHRRMDKLRQERKPSAEARAEAAKIREQIKALLRGEEVEEATPGRRAGRRGGAEAGDSPGKVGQGHALDSEALVNEYNQVRQRLGGRAAPVDGAALAAKLRKHATAVRKKTGCREVRFRVIEEGGKARVKAIPVK